MIFFIAELKYVTDDVAQKNQVFGLWFHVIGWAIPGVLKHPLAYNFQGQAVCED
jgi:hypothetical protein